MSGTVQIDAIDSVTGNPGPLYQTDNALHLRLSAIDPSLVTPTIPPFNAQLYSNTAASTFSVTDNLLDYDDWTFEVVGVDADDDITIQISLDGATFYKPGLVDVMTGAHIDQTAAMVEAPGVYKFGTATDTFTPRLRVRAIKVVRETAAGTNAVSVTATGGWA